MEKIEDFDYYLSYFLYPVLRAVVYIKGFEDLLYDEVKALQDFISKQQEVTFDEVEASIKVACETYSFEEQAFTIIRDADPEEKQFAADLITEFYISMVQECEREEDEKERFIEVFRECQLPMPMNEEYQLDIPAGLSGDDEQYESLLVTPTYIAIHYYEGNETKIPGDHRTYNPCLIEFLQDKDQLGDYLNICYNTPELNRISDSLDYRIGSDNVSNPTLAILFNKNDRKGYNKIMGDTELTGVFPRVFVETCYVALIDKDNPSDWNKISGFVSKKDIRKVLRELDKLVYGLAFNGPVYYQPAFKRQIEDEFWAEEVENQLEDLFPLDGETTERERKDRIKAVLDLKEWLSESIGESNPQTTEGDKSCTFDIIATDQNTVVDGEFMFTITTGFNIKGCQGDECVCCAYFYDNDGNFMTCDDEDYATGKSKQMNCGYHFTPKYNESNFSGVELTIPMRLLYKSSRSLSNKKQPYKIELSIYNFTIGEFLPSSSSFIDFYLSNV